MEKKKNATVDNKDSKGGTLRERHLDAINNSITTKSARATALQRFTKARKLDSIELGAVFTFSKGIAEAFKDEKVTDASGKVTDVVAKFISDEGRKLRATTLLGQSGLSNFIAKGELESEYDNKEGKRVSSKFIANSLEGWYDDNNYFTIPDGKEILTIEAESEEEALDFIDQNLTFPCKLICVSKPIKGFTTSSPSPAGCWQKWGAGYNRVISTIVFQIKRQK